MSYSPYLQAVPVILTYNIWLSETKAFLIKGEEDSCFQESWERAQRANWRSGVFGDYVYLGAIVIYCL